jgi:hypothetical protein
MITGEDGGIHIARRTRSIVAGRSYGRTARDIAAIGAIVRADIVRRIVPTRVRLVRECRGVRELHRGLRLRALAQSRAYLRHQDREFRIRAGR